ncbi:MAG TPA: hypothetical protein VM901_07145 [Bdellovibrionota bacterium]|jgi:hypothetical protein|nr:hypothetical protein [Bdellovibrionota bacterium]
MIQKGWGTRILQWALACGVGFAPFAEASKPRLSRDGKTCKEMLEELDHTRERASLANNSFVPLSVLLSSTKCKMVARNWREGPYHSKAQPTPGLLEMFRTADEASADVIQKLGLKGKIESPVYDKRSPLEGAAATLELMERTSPPKYIRNAVIVREGIFTVVPLLMLTERAGPKTGGKNRYVPVIAKGHQDLSQADVYTAVFTAWALSPWVGETPAQAFVHLVPMVVKRKIRGVEESDASFAIDAHQYLPIIREVYEDFMATVTSREKLDEVEPRRCTECARCPWAAYCRGLMKTSKDLSMMPLPPSRAQAEVFAKQGRGDTTKLSKLNINGDGFVDLAMRAGLSTSRLRYMVAHSKSIESDIPLRTRSYADPFRDKDIAVHIDFEDLMDPKIRSGVYLFGVETQDLRASLSDPLHKEFIFAKTLTQTGVDEAWANFMRFLDRDQGFDQDHWVVTMYSKHEIVKFEQQFDIAKGPLSDFTVAEKASPYFSQYGDPEKPKGRLIRRQEFFESYPDIKPEHIFSVIDRSIDLLDYTRHSIAFPTYSNSIKQILKYVNTKREPLEYPPGANGLESMAQAREGFTRGESAFLEWARAYNEIDIDVNRLVADFIRANADLPMAKELEWSLKSSARLEVIDRAVRQKNAIVQVLLRKSLFEKATKTPMRRWSEDQLERLEAILDRTDYLASRTKISGETRTDPRLKSAKLQKLRFEFMAGRQAKLYDFLRELNPSLDNEKGDQAQRAFVELLRYPAHLLGPGHLKQIVAINELQREYDRLEISYPQNPIERLELPVGYAEKVDTNPGLLELAESLGISRADMNFLWRGLYLAKAFGKE